jgi:hypothetical protein
MRFNQMGRPSLRSAAQMSQSPDDGQLHRRKH